MGINASFHTSPRSIRRKMELPVNSLRYAAMSERCLSLSSMVDSEACEVPLKTPTARLQRQALQSLPMWLSAQQNWGQPAYHKFTREGDVTTAGTADRLGPYFDFGTCATPCPSWCSLTNCRHLIALARVARVSMCACGASPCEQASKLTWTLCRALFQE